MTIQDVEVYLSSNTEERIEMLRDLLHLSDAAIAEVIEMTDTREIAEFFWNLQD